MLANRILNEEQTVIRRQFIDFFESERNEDKYHRRMELMMRAGAARLVMDIGDLLDYTPSTSAGGSNWEDDNASGGGDLIPVSLGESLLHRPGQYLPLLELALHDMVLRLQPQYLKVDYRSRAIHVGFDGPVGQLRSPRELYARHLNSMVALEGIITRQSTNRPRVLETVHYCPATNRFSRKEFRDQLTPMIDSAHLPTVNVLPKTDMEGNALRTELGLSVFMDSQCAMLQEAPERTPTGQLPRQVELRFDDDLVDCVKPGDRAVVVGVYMPYASADNKSFQSIVLVNHVVLHRGDTTGDSSDAALGDKTPPAAAGTSTVAVADEGSVVSPHPPVSSLLRPLSSLENHLLAFAKRETQFGGPMSILHTLSKSIAPTIYGLTIEKRAILLQLVGGVERQAHHSHIRGDINVLLVGEPSTAKSQLLRFVLSVSPLALNTTGKGSSGVGLTAAVSVDSYTGERSLSAGAMVLADRGILCIDEFDKMSAQDRVAMHEAMEQQTVTIAKAGIHASLNARCSVLAAANPIYGFYSVKHHLAFNVGLPESLLSRFDLTFIILDQHSAEHNRRIGKHILRNHMTAVPVGNQTQTTVQTVVPGGEARYGESGEGSSKWGTTELSPSIPDCFAPTTNSTGESIPSVAFLKAYIQFAKEGKPKLTERAQQMVSERYVQLRAEQHEEARGKHGFFVTARTLEAIVRLSTAHAKLRLSPVVEDLDVKAAMELLRASVHASSDATERREEDHQHVLQEQAEAAETPALVGVAVTEEGEREPQQKRPRLEESERPTVDEKRPILQRVLQETLRSLQRESKSMVSLEEIRERIKSGIWGNEDIPSDVLRSMLTALQGDVFVFESEDEGGSDTVQFI